MKTNEFTPLPEELAPPAALEFTPPGAEYASGEPIAPQRKKRRGPFRVAGVLLAAVLTVTARLPSAKLPVPTEDPPAPVVTEQEPTVSVPEPTVTPEPEPEPAPEPEPEFVPPVLPEYENPSGRCIVTVYSDTFDFNVMDIGILLQEAFDEAAFTELAMPEVIPEDGYLPGGFAICYSAYSSFTAQQGYNQSSGEFAYFIGDSLTLDELRLVPVWEEDGIRHVNIHVCWQPASSEDGELILKIDEEEIRVPVILPLYSEGIIFPCSWVPEKEGYTFVGWYNAAGEPVSVIYAESLFNTLHPDGNGGMTTDWSKPDTVTLYARFVPNT